MGLMGGQPFYKVEQTLPQGFSSQSYLPKDITHALDE